MFDGEDVLKREGYPYHGRVARVHGCALEAAKTYHLPGYDIPGYYEPVSIEEKIVVIADFCTIGNRVTTLEKRFECLRETFTERGLTERLEHLNKAWSRIIRLNEELNALWKRNIYLDYVRRFETRTVQKSIF